MTVENGMPLPGGKFWATLVGVAALATLAVPWAARDGSVGQALYLSVGGSSLIWWGCASLAWLLRQAGRTGLPMTGPDAMLAVNSRWDFALPGTFTLITGITVPGIIGLRIQMALVRASRSRLVPDAQGRRIAQSLHDGGHQNMLGLGMRLQLFSPELPESRPAVRSLFGEADTRSRGTLNVPRDVAQGIRGSAVSTHVTVGRPCV